MKSKVENRNIFDIVKWIVVMLLLAGGITGNQLLQQINISLRLIGWIILAGVVLGIAATTANGKKAVAFAREAKIELRKVVWPTRQEIMRISMMVVVLILLVGLVLWGIDSLLLRAVSLLAG